ncbi:hypothetical protein ACFYOG_35890 [Streptomyces sp. NPDC007818]|uniref:hypothetical protein n=1 Tax=Streptomyces sp. NPDC007818 TaxID=3364780 RepID=UPI00367410EA
MRNHWLTLALASGLAGLALLTTGCSSDGGGAKDTPSSSDGGSGGTGTDTAAMDKAQALRKCLRDQGVDVPDLQAGANPYAQSLIQPDGVSPEKWNKALTDCGSGPAAGAGAEQQQNVDQQVKIAECVRGKGFDMADPKPGPQGSSSGFKIPDGADPDKFLAALNECAA